MTTISAVGVCAVLKSDAYERITYRTRELEKPRRDGYGVGVETLSFEATHETLVLVVVHTL